MPEVKELPIACLYPHPDNPRKALGDLTELADSVKTNGILQNLTVIPAMQVQAVWNQICMEDLVPQDAYVVIIGHRRLAAAKQAGISTVPCTIASMTPQEQVRTMLIENMQRTELTPYEQAQGFQMMLNLGDTVETIARDSGFSESTVRSRVKLLKFDDQTFREATEKQITLETLSEVAKIENPKKRDTVLASYGSNNFQWNLRQELERQAAKKNKPAVKKEILAYATEVEQVDYNKYERVLSVGFADYKPGSATPEKMDKGEYVVDFSDRFATVYKKKKKAPVKRRPQEEIDRENEVKRRETELRELTESAYNLRLDFVESLTVGKADYPKLMKQACRALIVCKTLYYGSDFALRFEEITGVKREESHIPVKVCQSFLDEVDKRTSIAPFLIAAIYAAYGDDKRTGYWQKSYSGELPSHMPNSALDYIYEFLAAFGYKMSDVEKSLKDGTHALFLKDSPAQTADTPKDTDSTPKEAGDTS